MFSKWYKSRSGDDSLRSSVRKAVENASDAEATMTGGQVPTKPPEDPAVRLAQTAGKLETFDAIYEAAGVRSPASGFTILKIVDEVLRSEHLRSQPLEVKRCAVLVALEAAGVEIEEIVQDAAQREQALNGYESVQQKAMEEFEARKAKENREIQAEMERKNAEYSTRILANNANVTKEKERFRVWQAKKLQELQKMRETIDSCFSKQGSAQSGSSQVIELTGGH